MSAEIRSRVALASRVLGAAGLDDYIWGHASVRDPEGRGVWMKRSGLGLSEIRPEHVQLVGWDGTVLDGDGPRHIEYPIHTELLAARADAGGVVHIHPPHAIALAAANVELRPVSHAATLFVPPSVPRYDDTTDLIRTDDLGRGVAASLGDRDAVFLVNHGIATVGRDVETAVVTALLLEEACEQQLRTVGYGGDPLWTDDAEALEKRARIYSPAALANVWDYLVRRLERQEA